jgi:predicted outer membrane repeat protein
MLLAVPGSNAHAATITVTNCNDGGAGSLRNAVASAASGDTIDMSALTCRLINLTSGAIAIAQHDLSIVGGPPGLMKVDAGHRSSVFRHSGSGWLRIKRMNIANGFYNTNIESYGGCLYSAGQIELVNSNVHGCRVEGNQSEYASGGAIYAVGAVRVVYSWITGNTAKFGSSGAIYTGARLTLYHSHVSGNRALFMGGVTSGRGLIARYSTFSNNNGGTIEATNGDLIIENSTVSGNTETIHVGYPVIGWFGGSASIIDSTISGNVVWQSQIIRLGGTGTTSIVNSTIAFNQTMESNELNEYCLPRHAATVVIGGGPTLLDSTIISNNSCGGNPQYSVGGSDFPEPSVLIGANNLVTTPSGVALPADTITADPRLAALGNNGGGTKTHALPSDSPAIDVGNNEAGLEYDQRGPGYPRIKGAQADIGAFER